MDVTITHKGTTIKIERITQTELSKVIDQIFGETNESPDAPVYPFIPQPTQPFPGFPQYPTPGVWCSTTECTSTNKQQEE